MRILNAYFTQGHDITDVETLVKLAVEVGLDADNVRALLNSHEGVEEVKA